MNWEALFLSLKLAAVVCAILLLLGLPIAFGLVVWLRHTAPPTSRLPNCTAESSWATGP